MYKPAFHFKVNAEESAVHTIAVYRPVTHQPHNASTVILNNINFMWMYLPSPAIFRCPSIILSACHGHSIYVAVTVLPTWLSGFVQPCANALQHRQPRLPAPPVAANLISLFSSHWTIRTMAWTWQKLLCWGATFYVWSVAICSCLPCTPPRHSRFCLGRFI